MTKRVTESPDESTGKPLDGHDDHQHAGEMTAEESGSRVQQRRNLLKTISGGSVLAAGGLLPNQWAKPVIQTVILPAHAETSPKGGEDTTTSPKGGEDTTTSPNGGEDTTTTPGNGTTTTTTTTANCTDTTFVECSVVVTQYERRSQGSDGSYTATVSGSVIPGQDCSPEDLAGAELVISHEIWTSTNAQCEGVGSLAGSGSDVTTTVQNDGTYSAQVSGNVTSNAEKTSITVEVSFSDTGQFGNDSTICCNVTDEEEE